METSKSFRPNQNYLMWNPYELHKHLINNYVLTYKGATKLLQRNTTSIKRDIDVIKEHHKFLWNDDDEPITWEERLAKKYYDKLFKEFCIVDLTKYKENKVAMRWQTEKELVNGKGQFICSSKLCNKTESLKTWEVNFAYLENNTKKNALVKLRLCSDCSIKLNYRYKKKEIKRLEKRYHKSHKDKANKEENSFVSEKTDVNSSTSDSQDNEVNPWTAPVIDDNATLDEEFDQYLEYLLL